MAKTLTYDVTITRDGGEPVTYQESALWAWKQFEAALSSNCETAESFERLQPVLRSAWFERLATEGEAHQGIRNLFTIRAVQSVQAAPETYAVQGDDGTGTWRTLMDQDGHPTLAAARNTMRSFTYNPLAIRDRYRVISETTGAVVHGPSNAGDTQAEREAFATGRGS